MRLSGFKQQKPRIPTNLINYGHQANLPYDLSSGGQVDTDFQILIASNFNMLRLAESAWNTTSFADIQTLALYAKSRRFLVSIGAQPVDVTASGMSDFQNYVINTLAPWATNNSMDELALGNELELQVGAGTLTVAQVQAAVRSLATSVRPIFPGRIVYCTAGSGALVSDWAASGLGNIDMIGWTCYFTTNISDFEFGVNNIINTFPKSQFFLGEWNTPNGIADYAGNETAWAAELTLRKDFLVKKNVRSFYFCFRDGYFGVPSNTFAVMQTTNVLRPLVAQTLAIKTP